MTAQPHTTNAATETAVVECVPCGLDFAPVASPQEGACLAAAHNGLHHGGRAEAVLTAAPEQVTVAAQLGWTLDPAVLDDARDQAVPFTGDETASDRAWAARVDTAVQGMDVLDPAGFDVWADAHAHAEQPHLAEAELVTAWETWVRNEFLPSDHADEAEAGAAGDDAGWEL